MAAARRSPPAAVRVLSGRRRAAPRSRPGRALRHPCCHCYQIIPPKYPSMAALLSIGCANDTKCTDSLITPRALRAQYSAESAPDGILEAHQRGRPQLRQRRGVLPRRRHKARHPDFSVGVVGIALAVATVERGADAGDLI